MICIANVNVSTIDCVTWKVSFHIRIFISSVKRETSIKNVTRLSWNKILDLYNFIDNILVQISRYKSSSNPLNLVGTYIFDNV